MKGKGSILTKSDSKWLLNLSKILTEEGFYTKGQHLSALVDNAVIVNRPPNRPELSDIHRRRA